MSIMSSLRRLAFPFSVGKPAPPKAKVSGLADEINRVRRECSRYPLIQDEILDMHAQEWANVMAGAGLAWNDSAGMRLQRLAPDRPSAEVIASGDPSYAATVYGWMKTPEDRANVNGEWTHFGVGLACSEAGVPFWCVQFLGQ